jgi:hypothetical protein
MDPTGGLISAGGSLLTNIIGQAASGGDRQAQRRAIEALMREAAAIGQPELIKLIAEQLGPSAMEGVSANPDVEQAQMESLAGLGRIADSGGRTIEDRANQEMAMADAARRGESQRRAIEQMLSRRGLGNSGAAVAMRIGGQRDQADRQAQIGYQTAADAQRRGIQALMSRGQMAGQVRGQQFAEGSAKANSRDLIARYNAAARTDANRYNANLPQQQYENKLKHLYAMQGVTGQGANHYGQSADRTQQQWSDTGTGVFRAAGEAYSGFKQPPATQQASDYPGFTSAPTMFDEDER